MKKLIALSLLLVPFVSFAAGITPDELNNTTHSSFGSYVVCQNNGEIGKAYYGINNMVDHYGYTLSNCKTTGNYTEYLHFSWLETYRQLTGIEAQWTNEVAQFMAKYVGK